MQAVLAVVFALTLAARADDVNLAWKLKEGDTFYSKSRVVLEQTLTAMGRDVDQTITTDTVVRFKVKSVKLGATVVEMTYLTNKVTAKGVPGADAANDKLKGVTVTATLGGGMRVVKLEGYDKVVDALADGDDAKKATVKAVLPEAALKQMFTDTFGLGGAGTVRVGDTWKRADKIPFGGLGTVTADSTFKLDGVKGDVANVSWKGTGQFKGDDGQLPGLPVKVAKIELKTEKLTGSYTFDLTAGRVRESKTEMVMSGTMTLAADGKELTIDTKQKLTHTGAISDKNPITD
jgi:hypothetical protein